MQIEKWYFDFQNEDSLGYYYIGLLAVGGVTVAFSEIHHRKGDDVNSSGKISMGHSKSLRSIRSRYYSVQQSAKKIDLDIRHDATRLQGKWNGSFGTITPIRQPLFEDSTGSCSWKICMPKSAVELYYTGEERGHFTGNGYIDYVQLTIPTWKIPFQYLCWGRLFSGDRWICLFFLKDPESQFGGIAGSKGWTYGVIAESKLNLSGEVDAFTWTMNSETYHFEVLQKLHAGPILGKERMGWVPGRLRNWLSSGGFEKKFQVYGYFNNRNYSGIMEEVTWNNGVSSSTGERG